MSDEVSTNTTVEDTASPAPVADVQTSADTPAASAPATSNGSEQLTNSSAPTTAEPQAAQQPTAASGAQPLATGTQQPDTWQHRYSDLQSRTDRQVNQMRREMQQYQDEFNGLKQFRQQQEERAQQLNLKPWMKGHPENPRWKGLEERAKSVGQQLQNPPPGLTPEQDQAYRQSVMSVLSHEEQAQLKEHRNSQHDFQSAFFSDPQGTLAPMLLPIIQEQIQRATEQAQASYQVERDFESPELKPLVQEHAAEIQEALNAGVPYDYAKHMVQMFGRLKQMEQQLQGANKDAVMGKEQQRLSKSNATITRDPAAAHSVDPYELAKKEAQRKGIQTDDPRFFQILDRFSKT